MYKQINKIAFVITDTVTWSHLKNIICALPEDSYDIVIANEKQASYGMYMSVRALVRKLVGLTNGISIKRKAIDLKILKNIVDINDVIAHNLRYKCAVCVFPDMTGLANGKLKIELIAEKLIRASFISGAYTYMLDVKTNEIFDYILVSGKEQKSAYEELGIKAKVFDFGNPRLLQLSMQDIQEDSVYKQLDRNKKTILWVPSHGRKSCSLVNYFPIFSELQKTFNVIVSFPLGMFEDFCFLRWKLKKAIKLIIHDRDSASLMRFADFVFCDYGGSLLTSIYFDRNVCLLNGKKSDIPIIEKNFGKESPEILLRKDIISFDVTDKYQKFLDALNDDVVWENQKDLRQNIKEKYFSTSAEDAVKKICKFLLTELH